ncbi:hypothetical protein GGQ64_000842 [Rhizobium azooxidifex]|uniref:Uncharacterized protein n=1 Tax=Mycoplana azooxidifex TaxID=1636188 RepID=A0A7W6D2P4_9HYPH|nr:hypothetical protein [Mycoplana azooxidifex]MBB3975655.1 hypothetical protein [Mycoplana azooxidifex]
MADQASFSRFLMKELCQAILIRIAILSRASSQGNKIVLPTAAIGAIA